MGILIGLLVVICLISVITGLSVETVAFFVGIIIVGGIIYLVIKGNIENKEIENKKEELREDYNKYVNKYKKLLGKYKSSEYYLEEENDLCITTHYAILNNHIHILSRLDEQFALDDFIKFNNGVIPDEVQEITYDIDDIRYYKLEGSVYQQQRISGGGGGGSSIKGAVVGGLIAGNAGAIIGSRKKIDDIQTAYVEDDDRRVVITFKDDDELELPYKFYDRLLDYAPEKDYDNYIAAKKAKGRKK